MLRPFRNLQWNRRNSIRHRLFTTSFPNRFFNIHRLVSLSFRQYSLLTLPVFSDYDDKKKPRQKPDRERTKEKRSKNADLPQRCLPVNSAIETATDCYIVINKLGSGGFGDVYEVKRRADNRIFAVKVEFVKTTEDRRLKVSFTDLFQSISEVFH